MCSKSVLFSEPWLSDQVCFFWKVLTCFGKCHCHGKQQRSWKAPSFQLKSMAILQNVIYLQNLTCRVKGKHSFISGGTPKIPSWIAILRDWLGYCSDVLPLCPFFQHKTLFCFVSNAEAELRGLLGQNAVCPAAAQEKSASSQDKPASCCLSDVLSPLQG